VIADRSKESDFRLLLLIVIVKDAALANDLKVGHKAALLKLWDSNHTYLEYFLDNSRDSESRDLYFSPVLHKMVEVIDIANLTGNRNTLCILRSNLSIVD
jgi:hypothetical protein